MRFFVGVVIAVALGVILALWLRPTQASSAHPQSASGEQRQAAVPSARAIIATPRVVRQRDLEARDARYDPVALLREEDGRLRPHEIFESEPRDPKFAPVFERRVSTRVDTLLRELGLADKVRSIHVECKTLSCTTVLQTDPKDVTDVYDLVNGVSLGDVHSPSYDPARGTVTLDNLFRGDARRDDYDATFAAEAFAPALEFAKQRQLEQQAAKQP